MQPNEFYGNEYYGATTQSDTKPLGERLRDYYEPADFVTVQNIDSEPLRYQFADPKDEQFISEGPWHGETHKTAPPKVITLQPGETKLCPAFEADAMITTLVKKIATKKTQQQIDAGLLTVAAATTDWTNPVFQKEIIGKIVLGKEDLISKYNESLKQPNVDKDLGLEPQEPAKVGRPRKVTEGA